MRINAMRLVNNFFKFLNRIDHYVFGTGSWSLRAHELQFVRAVIGELGESEARAVQTQLTCSFFVDRSHPRISTLHFSNLSDAQLLDKSNYGDALFKVTTRVGGKTETQAVTFYDGRLFSVETANKGPSYKNKDVEILRVQIGKPSDTITHEIDRAEHGGS